MSNHRLHRLKSQIAQITSLLAIIIGIAGCGYTTRSFITDKYKNIYVAQFENKIDITKETDVSRRYKIYHPLLEIDISREIINRFVLDGTLSIVKEEEADLILRGNLTNYKRDALKYTTDEDVEEYRVSLVVDLTLLDRNQKILWQERGFIGDTTYFVIGPNSKSETEAINEAVEDLARRVVERVVEEW